MKQMKIRSWEWDGQIGSNEISHWFTWELSTEESP